MTTTETQTNILINSCYSIKINKDKIVTKYSQYEKDNEGSNKDLELKLQLLKKDYYLISSNKYNYVRHTNPSRFIGPFLIGNI